VGSVGDIVFESIVGAFGDGLRHLLLDEWGCFVSALGPLCGGGAHPFWLCILGVCGHVGLHDWRVVFHLGTVVPDGLFPVFLDDDPYVVERTEPLEARDAARLNSGDRDVLLHADWSGRLHSGCVNKKAGLWG
jgi:hypothetical protein